jgi:hypothetical protein
MPKYLALSADAPPQAFSVATNPVKGMGAPIPVGICLAFKRSFNGLQVIVIWPRPMVPWMIAYESSAHTGSSLTNCIDRLGPEVEKAIRDSQSMDSSLPPLAQWKILQCVEDTSGRLEVDLVNLPLPRHPVWTPYQADMTERDLMRQVLQSEAPDLDRRSFWRPLLEQIFPSPPPLPGKPGSETVEGAWRF